MSPVAAPAIGEPRHAAGSHEPASWPSPRLAWTAAILLMLANTLAFVDRQALALLVQPIKQDLGATDTEMSLLYGLSFTLFYVAIGLPVARVADRSNRRNIVAVSVALWSVATSLCGLAGSFRTLFAARVGVGAGEGGLSPAAYSMLADYFPRERLAAAMGVYQMGIYLGGALALLIGGLIATVVPPTAPVDLPLVGMVKGWQIVFLGLGLPGLLLSAVLLGVREPPRRGSATAAVPLADFLRHVGRRKAAYLGIGLAFALMIFVGNGTGAWIPAFFQRKFGWSTAQVGAKYGMVVFLCGTTGALAGGFFASWLHARGVRRGNLAASFLGFAALVPLTVGFPLVASPTLALAMIGGMNFFAGFNFGGGLATLQELTPNPMRASLSAVYLLLVNLVGATLGPTSVALVTDRLFADPQRLPEAIALTCAVASPMALVLLMVGMAGVGAAARQGQTA